MSNHIYFTTNQGFVGSNALGSGTPDEEGPSGPIKTDTFTTGSSGALSAYGGWEGFDVSSGSWRIDATADEAHSNNAVGIYAVVTDTLEGDDYYAEVNGKNGTTAGASFGACVRADASVDASDAYLLRILHDSGTWSLEKDVDGTTSVLASGAVASYAGTTYYTVKLQVEGTTLTSFIDGVQVDSRTDSTYATGKPGMFMRRTSPRITSFDSAYV